MGDDKGQSYWRTGYCMKGVAKYHCVVVAKGLYFLGCGTYTFDQGVVFSYTRATVAY